MPRDDGNETGLLQRLLTQALLLFERTPRWAKPSLVGATALLGLTLARGVFLLSASRGPSSIVDLLVGLVVAPLAGAIAGFAYVFIRIPARRLGVIGDALTGVLVSWAYVLAVLLPGRYFLNDDTLTTRQDWLIAGAVAGGFGVAGTILYWYYRRRIP